MRNLMSKQNCGVIYAAKRYSSEHSIAEFMSKYTDTPIDFYTPSIIRSILSNAIGELLNSMDRPGAFWYEYNYWKTGLLEYTDFQAMCAGLTTVAVKDKDGNYINGFRPVEEYKEFWSDV